MLALRKTRGEGGLELREVPPPPGPGEVTLETAVGPAAACGKLRADRGGEIVIEAAGVPSVIDQGCCARSG